MLQVREIVQSLKTKCRVEAVPLALKLACQVADILLEIKTGKVNFEERALFKIAKQTKKAHQIIFSRAVGRVYLALYTFSDRYTLIRKHFLSILQ